MVYLISNLRISNDFCFAIFDILMEIIFFNPFFLSLIFNYYFEKFLNIFSCFVNDANMSSDLMQKYLIISKLYVSMTSEQANERPNCEEILWLKNDWALTANEIVLFNESNNFENVDVSIFESQPFVHQFLIYKFSNEFLDLSKFFNVKIQIKRFGQ
jgi:hypothetical protein